MELAKGRVRSETIRGLPDVKYKMEVKRREHVRGKYKTMMEKEMAKKKAKEEERNIQSNEMKA
jgi:hypothetical protein